MKFDNYFVDVRTNEDFGWVPSYLSSLSISSRFNEAMDIWENSVNAVTYSLYIYQNQNDGVEVFFTDNIQYFSDPATEFAYSVSCVANNKFVVSCSENDAQLRDPVLPNSPKVTQARIAFNGTASFPTNLFSDVNCVAVPWDRTSFTYVAMHEMGHILGLPHCWFGGSVMYYQMPLGPNVCYIASGDVTWMLTLILQNPVISLEINPFLDKKHYFFEYEPEIFPYILGNIEKNKTSESIKKEGATK